MADERKHILIVEDNESMLQLYTQVFTASGFRVTTASDGHIGWIKAQSEHPNLILLDMVLPRVSGGELLHKLQKEPATSKIPVVVFSSVNSAEGIQKAFQSGAIEFISKSTNSPKQVISKVQSVLEKSNPQMDGRPLQVCPHCRKEI